jgi:hypothetical protein
VGNIYRQFSVVMASAIGFSAFLALTLTPALCATLLKPVEAGHHHAKTGFCGWFNRGCDSCGRSGWFNGGWFNGGGRNHGCDSCNGGWGHYAVSTFRNVFHRINPLAHRCGQSCSVGCSNGCSTGCSTGCK